MTTLEIESYLTCNGYDRRMTPEIQHMLAELHYLDLSKEPVERLSVANDSVRMSLRIVADGILARRVEIAKSRDILVAEVPYRTYQN